ncbi:MAG: ABC transporter permease, partial [Cyclobacteriaceae bacterium]|nr:ABC transporter permease [Cyclobacteriaceae bacterium HetDA_MAG_MS6]
KYHANYERIARVMQRKQYNGNIRTTYPVPFPLGSELQSKYPEDFEHVVMSSWEWDSVLGAGNKRFLKNGIFMDVGAPQMLSLKMLEGKQGGLDDPKTILLSASCAKALFGEKKALHKTVLLDNDYSLEVGGVYADLPANTTFSDLQFIAPWQLYISMSPWIQRERDENLWDNNSHQLFVQIAQGQTMGGISQKIKDVKIMHLNDQQKSYKPEVFLHPMKDWHLRSNWEQGIKAGGPIRYVWLSALVGLAVLLLACINFINIATAQSQTRAKEVGIRKSVGAARQQQVQQFLTEALLTVTFAYMVAIAIAMATLPYFNRLVGQDLSLPIDNPLFWMGGLIGVLAIGFLAGSYPAFYLSSFQAIQVLKGARSIGKSTSTFRHSLVVFQFTISIGLMIATWGISQQIQFSKDRPLGFNKTHTLAIMMPLEYERKYDILKNELMTSGVVAGITKSNSLLTDINATGGGYDWLGKDPSFKTNFVMVTVTPDYGKTVEWEFSSGRDFSDDMRSDATTCILNEAAVKYMGITEPIGKTISQWSGDLKIIGIVKDIVMESPFQKVRPTIYTIDRGNNANWIILRLAEGVNFSESLEKTGKIFEAVAPSVPFDFHFTSEAHAAKFSSEEQVEKVFRLLAVIAIFISCLGLYGLVSFVVEQRTKEISIRKVLGAGIRSILVLVTSDFVKLVLMAMVIAIPIGWYFLVRFLESFTYRVEISWSIFIISGVVSILVAVLTVSHHTLKVTFSNPVDSLRSE